MWKTTGKILAGAVVVAHVGILGHLIRPQQSSVPLVQLPPVNEYSTFRIRATRDGYDIEYIGNDPRVLATETEADQSNGVFGVGGRRSTSTRREYTQDNQPRGGEQTEEGKLSAEQIACIEAAGGGRSNGALIGGSVASGALVPAVINIPYVGWLAAGWMTLFGTEAGGNIGAEIATTVKGCL